MNDRMLKAALRYAALGWYVFPLRTDGDIKAPLGSLGKGGHLKASNDPEVVREWWTRSPESGIGLYLAKSGLIAVDVDPRHNGYDTLATVTAEHGPLDSLIVSRTGSGGDHRLFAAPEGLRSAPGRVGPKGGGIDLKWQGYIVLPPSKHPDGPHYWWEDKSDPYNGHIDLLPEIPSWVLARAGYSTDSVIDPDDEFVEDAQTTGLSSQEVREALFDVPNTGDREQKYDEWLGVLSGVYHEFDGANEGRDLAYEWSSQAMKHTDEEFSKTWNSLDISGKGRAPITFRFVLKMAKEFRDAEAKAEVAALKAQFTAAADTAALRQIAEAVKRTDLHTLDRGVLETALRDRYKVVTGGATLTPAQARGMVRYEAPEISDVPEWLEGWMYVQRENVFVKGAESLPPEQFNNRFNKEMLSRKDKLEGRAVPETRASDAALNRFEIPQVYGRMYLPGEDQFFWLDGSRYCNLYSAASLPETPATLSQAGQEAGRVLERHFEHLIADPRERALVLSWFCFIVQTNQRPNWAVLVQGPEGSGKSFLLRLMQAVLGPKNAKPLFVANIQENTFNDWAEGSQLTVVEEVRQNSKNRYAVLERLQPLITNDTIEIHRKFMSPYSAPNTAAYLLLTNHRDALPLGEGDTRYFMVASPMQTKAEMDRFKESNPAYFPALFDCVNNRAGALRRWMLDYPLHPEFNPRERAPHSRERDHAVALNKPELFSAIEDALEEQPSFSVTRFLVDPSDLVEALADHGQEAMTPEAVSRALRHMGFTQLGRFRVGGGLKRRFWTTEPEKFGRTDDEKHGYIKLILE